MMKTSKLLTIGLSIIGVGVFMSGCGAAEQADTSSDNSHTEETIKVVTTFYPMYDFTKNVAQDLAEVSLLLPAGTEVHDFEPSAKDVAEIQEADVFIYNSEEMETWVPSVLDTIDSTEVLVIDASEGITLIENEAVEDHNDSDHEHAEHTHDHDEEGQEEHSHAIDPHIWLDPVLAQEEVNTIKEGLIEADPENEEGYEVNADAYNQKLEALDQEYRGAFQEAENRTFVTQHAAFAYLAQQYDLNQVSIAGLSSEEEPSPAKLAELSELVDQEGMEYIYFEDNSSSKIAETLASEVGVELALLSPLEGVSQADQDAGVDYIEVMKNNLESLKKSIR